MNNVYRELGVVWVDDHGRATSVYRKFGSLNHIPEDERARVLLLLAAWDGTRDPNKVDVVLPGVGEMWVHFDRLTFMLQANDYGLEKETSNEDGQRDHAGAVP